MALARSGSISHIWGRECPNFGSRSFIAFSRMPELRALGIGCQNVDDEALATLHFEMEKKQEGKASELMDLLIAKEWKSLFNIPDVRVY